MAYRLRPAEPFTAEIRSVVEDQLTRAMQALEHQPCGPHRAIHDARKRFKRARAVYRLIQPDVPEFRDTENHRIRAAAQSLSVVRDADALIETLDHITDASASPEERAALATASRTLIERRDRIADQQQDLPARIEAAAKTCRETIAALDGLVLDDYPRRTARCLSKAWKKQRRKAWSALSRCLRRPDAETFHELRKSGQTYCMHLALLREIWPSAMLTKQTQTRRLVKLLGREHDLSVLRNLVYSEPELFSDHEARAVILGVIVRHQQALRAEALDIAYRVFVDSPENEAALIAILWERAAVTPVKQRRPLKRDRLQE